MGKRTRDDKGQRVASPSERIKIVSRQIAAKMAELDAVVARNRRKTGKAVPNG